MSHCRWVVVAEESFDQLCQKRAAEAAGDGISTPPPSTNLAVPPPNSPTSRPKAQQSSPPSSQQSAVNVPKAQDLTPTSPNLTEQVPSTQDQLPSTQDQLPSTQDQLPRAQDKLPSSQADHPAAARDGRAPTKGKWRQKTEATPGGLTFPRHLEETAAFYYKSWTKLGGWSLTTRVGALPSTVSHSD